MGVSLHLIIPLLSRIASRAGLVTLRQTFVRRCQRWKTRQKTPPSERGMGHRAASQGALIARDAGRRDSRSAGSGLSTEGSKVYWRTVIVAAVSPPQGPQELRTEQDHRL